MSFSIKSKNCTPSNHFESIDPLFLITAALVVGFFFLSRANTLTRIKKKMEDAANVSDHIKLQTLRASLDLLKRLYRFGTLEAYEHIEGIAFDSDRPTDESLVLKGPFRLPCITKSILENVLENTGVPVYFDGQVAVREEREPRRKRFDPRSTRRIVFQRETALRLAEIPAEDLGPLDDAESSVIDEADPVLCATPEPVDPDSRKTWVPSGKVSLFDVQNIKENDHSGCVHVYLPVYSDCLHNAARFLGTRVTQTASTTRLTVWPFVQHVSTMFPRKYGLVSEIEYIDADTAFLRIENLLFKAEQHLSSSSTASVERNRVPIGFKQITVHTAYSSVTSVANSLDVLPPELHSLLNAACVSSFAGYVQHASYLITYLEDIHIWALHCAKFIDATYDLTVDSSVPQKPENLRRVVSETITSLIKQIQPAFLHPDLCRLF